MGEYQANVIRKAEQAIGAILPKLQCVIKKLNCQFSHTGFSVTDSVDIAEICAGNSAIFRAESTGCECPVTYRWQVQNIDTGEWEPIGGALGDTYITPLLESIYPEGGTPYTYRVAAECAGCPPIFSEGETVIVQPAFSFGMGGYPVVCQEASVLLFGNPIGGTGVNSVYQWEMLIDEEWVPIDGQTSQDLEIDLSVTPLDSGTYQFRITGTQDGLCSATSEPYTVTIMDPIESVTITADDYAVCPGQNVTLTATVVDLPVGVNATYNWQIENIPPGDWHSFFLPINPSTTTVNTFVTSTNNFGWENGANNIRVIVSITGSTGCSSVTSNTIVATKGPC